MSSLGRWPCSCEAKDWDNLSSTVAVKPFPLWLVNNKNHPRHVIIHHQPRPGLSQAQHLQGDSVQVEHERGNVNVPHRLLLTNKTPSLSPTLDIFNLPSHTYTPLMNTSQTQLSGRLSHPSLYSEIFQTSPPTVPDRPEHSVKHLQVC